MEPKYWLVGAKSSGTDERLDDFLQGGYWHGWDKNNPDMPPSQQQQVSQIRLGDRIAVKRLIGVGQSEMRILALGIVRFVEFWDNDTQYTIYVDWLAVAEDIVQELKAGGGSHEYLSKFHHFPKRTASLGGCIPAINGPFVIGEATEWLQSIFYI